MKATTPQQWRRFKDYERLESFRRLWSLNRMNGHGVYLQFWNDANALIHFAEQTALATERKMMGFNYEEYIVENGLEDDPFIFEPVGALGLARMAGRHTPLNDDEYEPKPIPAWYRRELDRMRGIGRPENRVEMTL